jgi:hypothetical protein
MDTDNIETATNVWRWNINGLGYSKNGYAGPYELAMTMDGAIVADMITTGILNSIAINNGNGAFTVDKDGNVVANSFSSNNANITGGGINLSASSNTEAKIIVKNDSTGVSMDICPIRMRFVNSDGAERISLFAPTGIIILNDGIGETRVAGSGITCGGSIKAETIKAKHTSLNAYYKPAFMADGHEVLFSWINDSKLGVYVDSTFVGYMTLTP